jgi:hypothetical protein
VGLLDELFAPQLMGFGGGLMPFAGPQQGPVGPDPRAFAPPPRLEPENPLVIGTPGAPAAPAGLLEGPERAGGPTGGAPMPNEPVPFPPARPAGIGGGPEETPPARPADLTASEPETTGSTAPAMPPAQSSALSNGLAMPPAQAQTAPNPFLPAGGVPADKPAGGLLGGLFGGGQKKSGSLLSNPLFMMGLGLLSGKTLSEGFQNAMHGLIAAQPYADKERERAADEALLGKVQGMMGGLTPSTSAPSVLVPGTEGATGPTAQAGPGGAPDAQALTGLRAAASRGRGGAPSERPFSAPPGLADAIQKHATAAGLNPVDLATIMSYETGGTFDPWKAGPRTQWGQHRGLIQWGEPQARQYGVSRDTPVEAQVAAAVKYLQDHGVKPGMGRLDMYSAINAGWVGRNDKSDARNGGAPGTVADKVRYQMGAHQRKAEALLAGAGGAPSGSSIAGAPPPALSGVPNKVASAPPVIAPAVSPAAPGSTSPALPGPNVGARPRLDGTAATSPDLIDQAPPPSAAGQVADASGKIVPVGMGKAQEQAGVTPTAAPTPQAQKAVDAHMAKTGAPAIAAPGASAASKPRLVDPTTGFEIVSGGSSAATNQKAQAQMQAGFALMQSKNAALQSLGKSYIEAAQKNDPHRLLRNSEGAMFRQSLTDLTDLKQIEGTRPTRHNVGEGTALTDNDGRVLYQNPKAEKDERTTAQKDFEYSRTHAGFDERQERMKRAGAMQIGETVTQREQAADHMGLQGDDRKFYVANGKLPTTAERDPSEGQSNAALYASRMEAAEKVISDPAATQAMMDPKQRAASLLPLGIGNYAVSQDYQKGDQARRDFVNATLRRESGAAISPSEFENANKQYFPQPGDGPEVLAQKTENRRLAIQGITAAAGRAMKRLGQSGAKRATRVIGNTTYFQDANGDWFKE